MDRKTKNNDNYLHFYKAKLVNTNQPVLNLRDYITGRFESKETKADYISSFNKDFHQDSIPIIIINKGCPSCIHKIGEFIKTIQNHNLSYRKFILVSQDTSELYDFERKYSFIRDTQLITVDTNGIYYKMNYLRDFSYFIRQNPKVYFYQKIEVSELDQLLKYICPSVKVVDGFCIPIKD